MKKHLLLLHGALGSKSQFIHLKKILQAHFKVHSLDFSGHGTRVLDPDFSMELFVGDVLDFMKSNSIASAAIFGYSMGGYVGLKLAIDFPEKVQKLLILGTKIQWTPESAEKETKMLDPQKMEEKIPKFITSLQKNHAMDWKKLVNKTASMMHELGHGKALKMEDFHAIEIPVLVALGSEDGMVSKEESKVLAEHLKYGKFLEITAAKHPIAQVDPQKIATILTNFLQD